MNAEKIPSSDSINELAEFWATHDLTDFEDELEEVTEPDFQREKVVKVRLPSTEADAVESLAKSRGIPPADLIRGWVLEKVHASG